MPMQTALFPLQKAIFQKLTSYQPLMSKIVGVFDDVPQEYIDDTGNAKPTVFPYIQIDLSTNNGFDTKSSFGENITMTLNTYSRYSGHKETYDLMNLIYEALKTPLSLEGGFTIAQFVPGRPDVITDIDGKSKHGILELNFWIL
jgi:hypothetical protein